MNSQRVLNGSEEILPSSYEAQIKTLKYRPDLPDRFGPIGDVRAYCHDYFTPFIGIAGSVHVLQKRARRSRNRTYPQLVKRNSDSKSNELLTTNGVRTIVAGKLKATTKGKK